MHSLAAILLRPTLLYLIFFLARFAFLFDSPLATVSLHKQYLRYTDDPENATNVYFVTGKNSGSKTPEHNENSYISDLQGKQDVHEWRLLVIFTIRLIWTVS